MGIAHGKAQSHLHSIEALKTYGDEQYADGVQDGWQQAINKLQDIMQEHPEWVVAECLMALDDAKDKR